MTKARLKEQAQYFISELSKTYPDAVIELNYDKDDPWQLLVVVALSAQTTDKKVNEISSALFARFPHVEDFARASVDEIEPYIKSIGLFRNKAKNLVSAARRVVEDFHGVIPRTRAELETIAGVGRKTSAVIVANAFDTPAIAVDTHVARVSFRLGLTKQTDPNKIEDELTSLLAPEQLVAAHHTIIFHGRRLCFAKKPHCSQCPVRERCPRHGVTSST